MGMEQDGKTAVGMEQDVKTTMGLQHAGKLAESTPKTTSRKRAKNTADRTMFQPRRATAAAGSHGPAIKC